MKKNILIVIHGLGLGGGTEVSASTVGNNLYEKGYNIIYLTFDLTEKKVNFLGKEICLGQKNNFGTLGAIFNMFQNAYYIKKYSKEYNIDTIISHYESSNFASIFSKIFFLNKPKLIINIHNDIKKSYKGSFLTELFIKLFYDFSDIIINVSKKMMLDNINNFKLNSKKTTYIYNGFDIQNIIEKGKEDLGEYKKLFNNGKFTFINIGRLTRQKNQKLLLDAFDKINQKYKNTQLLILHGDGELEQDLKKQRELLLSKENIHFLGNQKNPFNFLKSSDCFVLSSLYEGFPMVIPEALSCSLPVISTDCNTGPNEALNNNVYSFELVKEIKKSDYGILIPNNDLDKLYEAMEMIYLDEDLRNNYKKKSLERSKDFDINNIIKEWEKII